MKKRDGFTIIELLVVISIIALLIAILLPFLAGARDRARFIKWKGYSHNLRIDQDTNTYYNFEEQGTGHDLLWNRAAGDAFQQAKEDYEPESLNGQIMTAVSTNLAADIPTSNMWVSGRWKGKGALDFDKSLHQYVRIEDTPIDLQGTWSWAAWGRIASTPGSYELISTRKPDEAGFDAKFRSGDVHGDIGNGSGWIDTSCDYAPPGGIKLDTWYFVAYTVTPTGYKLYVNGGNSDGTPNQQENFGSPPRNPVIHDSDHDIYLGRRDYNSEEYDGIMDEQMIFKKELDPEQIAEMYSVGKTRKKD